MSDKGDGRLKLGRKRGGVDGEAQKICAAPHRAVAQLRRVLDKTQHPIKNTHPLVTQAGASAQTQDAHTVDGYK